MPLRLELSSSEGAVLLCRHDDPTALISRYEAAQRVAAIKLLFGDLSPIPFQLFILALAYSLGPSHPQSVLVAAESFSTSVAGTPAICYFN